MIVTRRADEPSAWFVSFHRTSRRWWAPYVGKYKHVAAFAWSEGCRTWLWLDVGLDHTRVILLPPGGESEAWIAAATADADILHMAVRVRSTNTFRLGFTCVSAVKHLLGLRGSAVRPDALWRLMVREGATITHEQRPAAPAGRPDAGSPAQGDDAAAADRGTAGRLV